jgi:hypothetical protein
MNAARPGSLNVIPLPGRSQIMTLRFSLLGLIGLTTLAGLASAALVQPSVEWTSVVVSLTVAAIVWQVLRAIFSTGQARAAACGWLLFAIGYLAVALGPWLSSHLAPQLLSSKALVYAQANWRKESLPNANQQQQLFWDMNGQVLTGISNTIVINNDGWSGNYNIAAAGADPTAGANFFHLSGHWLCAWIFGLIGCLVAVQLQRWGELKAKQ